MGILDALKPPPHILVVVPGFMGSKLRDRRSGELVWPPSFSSSNMIKALLQMGQYFGQILERLSYSGDELEADGIVDTIEYMPGVKQEHYRRLLKFLEQQGYSIDPEKPDPERKTAYTFGYDWRQDQRISARQLGDAIRGWLMAQPGAKAWVLAHGSGGTVARWFIEKEGGRESVERLFLLAAPWDGSPSMAQMLLDGSGMKLPALSDRGRNQYSVKTKAVYRTFPSAYQMIPHRAPFLFDDGHRPVDLFSDSSWLDTEVERALLADAWKFSTELGAELSVDTACFFGRQIPTVTSGEAVRGADGRVRSVKWNQSEAGDGVYPESSTQYPQARVTYAFNVRSGEIYFDDSVLPQLAWELSRRFGAGPRAAAVAPKAIAILEPDSPVYQPQEPITLLVRVTRSDAAGTPLAARRVGVQAAWGRHVPGKASTRLAGQLPAVELAEAGIGRYTGMLPAPEFEGYYRLQAEVELAGQPEIKLEEMILVARTPASGSPQAAERTPPSADALAGREWSLKRKMLLVDALLACKCMAGAADREALIQELPADIRNRVKRNAAARLDVLNVLSTSLDYPAGLSSLLEAVRIFEGGSIPMQEVDQLLNSSEFSAV